MRAPWNKDTRPNEKNYALLRDVDKASIEKDAEWISKEIDESKETIKANELANTLRMKCPELPDIPDKEAMSKCLDKIPKEEREKGSFTIQCMCRIKIIYFSSIFSGSGSRGNCAFS